MAALFIRTVEMAERPVGQLVVERCRRGTRRLSGRAQLMNRVLLQYIVLVSRANCAYPNLSALAQASTGERLRPICIPSSLPPVLSGGQSKERALARDYATPSGEAARPRGTSHDARRPQATVAAGPPAPTSFGKSQCLSIEDLQLEWWHGVGRQARQNGGIL